MSGVDKNTLVHPGDILAAVRAIHGPATRVLGWDVKQGTENIQGFASLMLRAKVTVKTGHGEQKVVSVMVKRKPALAAHAAMLDSMGNIIAREGAFFNLALPRLLEKSPDLPIVRALVSHDEALLMEDLCEAGFETVAKTFTDIGRNGALNFPTARIVVRKLAKYHASSLGQDWKNIMPAGYFDPDPMLEGPSSEQFKMFMNISVQNMIIPIMKKIYLDTPSINDYITFMSSPQFFDTILQFVKYDASFTPNVLLHGDCHLNNIMFKLDEERNATDLRFIDFQIVRYGPPTSDLVYFLYTSCNKEFREKHEADLLRIYVEAFNAEACVTPDIMDHDKLVAHYERARYFGMVISLGMRPMMLLPEFQPPSEGGEISDEFFEGMKDMDKAMGPALIAFDNDDFFNKELRSMISHSMAVMHKYVYPE